MDEFQYAMSWKRAFQQIYMRYCWLQSYAQINQIAIQTIHSEIAKRLLAEREDSKYIKQLNLFLEDK